MFQRPTPKRQREEKNPYILYDPSRSTASSAATDKEEHIYYNVRLSNNGSQPLLCRFAESRNIPLVGKPDNFHMTCLRFSIPAQLIPIFTFKPDTYYVRLWDLTNNVGYDAKVTAPPPSTGLNITSYQMFIDQINKAIAAAYGAGVAGGSPQWNEPGSACPTFTWNPLLGPSRLSLFFDYKWAFNPAQGVAGNYGAVAFNDALMQFFSGSFNMLPREALPPGNQTGWNYFAQFENGPLNNINVLTNPWLTGGLNTGANYQPFSVDQEFNALYLWNQLRGITFRSGSVSVKSEYLPNDPTDPTGSNSQQILTDFEPAVLNGWDERTVLQYVPNFPRYLDLLGGTPMSSFDIQVFWTDNTGTEYPLMIPPGQQMTAKFQFTKKGQTVD